MKQQLRWITILSRIALVVIALSAGVTLVGMNQWHRGLTVNRAEVSPDAEDPRLVSPVLAIPPSDVALRIRNWADSQPRWSIASTESSRNETRLHLTRRTRLFRFTDDVRVQLVAVESGTRVTAQSQSRLGKGDLGQNARNLRELLQAISAAGLPDQRS